MSVLIEKGIYTFEENTGVNDDEINVYFFRPTTWKPGDDIAFVMHGVNRDAGRYLNDWSTYAKEKNILVVCPEFSNEKYPGSGYYNTGNIINKGKIQDKTDWTFSAIDRIANEVKIKFNSLNSKTLLYGHSAGAQMVHRYAIFDDNTNFDLIISANAGWYTMPDSTIYFPYGVGGVSISNDEWRTIFSKPVVILLGEEDIIRDSNLRITVEADEQGENRFERGNNFYEKMKSKAKELGAEFNWKLATVPQVGHSDYRMAKSAVDIFLETDKTILVLDNNIKSPVTAASHIKIIDASSRTTTVKVSGNALANTIMGGIGNDTLDGGNGIDVLKGGKGNDCLNGGVGNDYMYGGLGDDVLVGGTGKDKFFYASGDGKDIIYDYEAGNDVIQLMKGSITGKKTNGNDVILTVGDGSIILKNAMGKKITVIDVNGKTSTLGPLVNVLPKNAKYADTKQTRVSLLTAYEGSFDAALYATSITNVDATKTTKGIALYGNAKANTLEAGKGSAKLYGLDGNDTLVGSGASDLIDVGNGNDCLKGGAGNDTMRGGVGADILYGGVGNDTFLYATGDGKDVIWDYETGKDVIQLTKGKVTGKKASGKDVILTVGDGSLTLKNAMGKKITLADAAGKKSTLAPLVNALPKNAKYADSKQTKVSLLAAYAGSFDSALYATSITNVDATKTNKGIALYGNAKANTLKAGKGSAKLYGRDGNDTLVGSGASDLIDGGNGNDCLKGGAGNDTMRGGVGADILYGGVGNDTFLYATGDGKDVIWDYETGKDVIQLTKGKVTGKKASGKDVILTVGDGSLTLKNTMGKKITLADAAGKKTNLATGVNDLPKNASYANSKRVQVNLAKGYVGTFDASLYAPTIKGIDATKDDNALSLYGNGNANVIKAGKGNTKLYGLNGSDTLVGGSGKDYLDGGAGNDSLFSGAGDDTLFGGKGNDTLCGGKGKDIFLYGNGDGHDKIISYEDSQAIKIMSGTIDSMQAINAHYDKGRGDFVVDVVMSIGKGSITLNEVGWATPFTIIDASDKKKNYYTTMSPVKLVQ